MDEPTPKIDPADAWPSCPKCGERLYSKGKIVDAGGYKKWAEEWHCGTHGVIGASDGKDPKAHPR